MEVRGERSKVEEVRRLTVREELRISDGDTFQYVCADRDTVCVSLRSRSVQKTEIDTDSLRRNFVFLQSDLLESITRPREHLQYRLVVS